MSKVAIVSDSTEGFPESAIEGLPIHSVPLQVIWGDSTYQDSRQLTHQPVSCIFFNSTLYCDICVIS